MMKILKITILWIAGALVLGHGIVPHHHHEAEQTECANDSDAHKHQNTTVYTETCTCQHDENHSEVCNLDQRTIIKQNNVGNFATITKRFSLAAPEKEIKSIFNSFAINKLCEYFLSKTPSRAPPIA